MKPLLQRYIVLQKSSVSDAVRTETEKPFLSEYVSRRRRIWPHLILGVFVFLLCGSIIIRFGQDSLLWNAIHFERWASALSEFDRSAHQDESDGWGRQKQVGHVTLANHVHDANTLKQNRLQDTQLEQNQTPASNHIAIQNKSPIVPDAELLARTPLWNNPYLAFLPVGAKPEYALWQARMQIASQQRDQRNSVSAASFAEINEVEPNDSLNSANFIAQLGTAPDSESTDRPEP